MIKSFLTNEIVQKEGFNERDKTNENTLIMFVLCSLVGKQM